MNVYPPVNLALTRQLERAEATANAAFVDARALVSPESGATWIEVAGVRAMFDGIGSPLTQTFGLGLFSAFLEAEFEAVEAFFSERGSSTVHEVSSFTPQRTADLLLARGYARVEDSVVLVRPVALATAQAPDAISVRHLARSDRAQWARVSALGWASEDETLAAFIESFGQIAARAEGVECFLAESNGEAIGAASLNVSPGVALLAGASTIPAARRRGAQQALLNARLAFAAAAGLQLAMVVTQPESGSMRNAERQGFHAVYTRTKWERRLRTG